MDISQNTLLPLFFKLLAFLQFLRYDDEIDDDDDDDDGDDVMTMTMWIQSATEWIGRQAEFPIGDTLLPPPEGFFTLPRFNAVILAITIIILIISIIMKLH